MKYLFIALAYFALGFTFVELSLAYKLVSGFAALVFTCYLMLTLFDDQIEPAPTE